MKANLYSRLGKDSSMSFGKSCPAAPPPVRKILVVRQWILKQVLDGPFDHAGLHGCRCQRREYIVDTVTPFILHLSRISFYV
jgi:hypothetical protein